MWSIVGDGENQMTLQEMPTIVDEELPDKIALSITAIWEWSDSDKRSFTGATARRLRYPVPSLYNLPRPLAFLRSECQAGEKCCLRLLKPETLMIPF